MQERLSFSSPTYHSQASVTYYSEFGGELDINKAFHLFLDNFKVACKGLANADIYKYTNQLIVGFIHDSSELLPKDVNFRRLVDTFDKVIMENAER